MEVRGLGRFLWELSMWPLVLLFLLFFASPGFGESSLSEKYERDSNLFNPDKLFSSDNPLNSTQNYPTPNNSSNPAFRFDPRDPTNSADRYIPNNPFNPANETNPQNLLNPPDRYGPNAPFQLLNHSR